MALLLDNSRILLQFQHSHRQGALASFVPQAHKGHFLSLLVQSDNQWLFDYIRVSHKKSSQVL